MMQTILLLFFSSLFSFSSIRWVERARTRAFAMQLFVDMKNSWRDHVAFEFFLLLFFLYDGLQLHAIALRSSDAATNDMSSLLDAIDLVSFGITFFFFSFFLLFLILFPFSFFLALCRTHRTNGNVESHDYLEFWLTTLMKCVFFCCCCFAFFENNVSSHFFSWCESVSNE